MDIVELRNQIDETDDQIKELFLKRMAISTDIARYKAQTNTNVTDPNRERTILNRLTEGESEEMQGYLKTLYTTLFDLSKSHQRIMLAQEGTLGQEIKACIAQFSQKPFPERAHVAIQGVEGAYSSLACRKMFPYATVSTFQSFRDVFEAVDKGFCQYGILPVENNTVGSVSAVYELMQDYRFYIVRSDILQINHNLMAKKGTKLADVKEILSHPQALRQCNKYLETLENVTLTPFDNTAMAAQKVQQSNDSSLAAICSGECAQLYGLEILEKNIADSDNNHTRFICISKQLEVYPGADQSSFLIKLPHQAGALYRMLARFAALDINLTKLESRPIKGSDFEFMFYFEVDTSIYNENLYRLINQLEKEGVDFAYLGSYLQD